MLYKNKESPSEAIIRNEKKKRKKKFGRESPRKRVKYLLKGQTWQLCGKDDLEKKREVSLKFASSKKTDQNEKNVSSSRLPPQNNKGAVLLFPPQF